MKKIKTEKTSKDKKVNNRLKNSTIITWTIVILLLTTAIISLRNLFIAMDKSYDDMNVAINSEVEKSKANYNLNKIHKEMIENSAQYILEYSSYFLEENGQNALSLDLLSAHFSKDIYFVYDQYTIKNALSDMVIKAEGGPKLGLTDDEISELLASNTFSKIDENGVFNYYKSMTINGGTVIVKYNESQFASIGIMHDDDRSDREDYIICADKITNAITKATDFEDLVGVNLDEVYTIYYKITNKDDPDELIYWAGVKGLGSGIALQKNVNDDIIVDFIPLTQLFLDGIRSAVVPIIIFWIVIIIILIYAIKIKNEKENNQDEYDNKNAKYYHLFKKIYLDKEIVSHIMTLGLFGFILIAISIFYISTLINYSDQSILANSNLKQISNTYSNNIENRSKAVDALESEFIEYAKTVAWGYVNSNTTINDTTINHLNDRLTMVDNIEYVNASGTVVVSTKNDSGYTLGRNDNELNSLIWKILDGESDYEVYNSETTDDGGYRYNVLVRSQDGKGVIAIDIQIDNAANYIGSWNLDETLRTADFGMANIVAVDLHEPDYINYKEASSGEVTKAKVTLSNEMLTSGYAGINSIKGVRYYIDTIVNVDNDIVFLSAFPTRKFSKVETWTSLKTLTLGIIAFMALVIFGIARVTPSEEFLNTGAESSKKIFDDLADIRIGKLNVINEGFKTVINNMIVITGVLLVMLLFVDYLIEDEPLIVFLLGSQWSKGVNLFSITMILIIVVCSLLAGFIFNKLIMIVGSNMGPRGITIGHLLCSVSRFIILVVIIIWSLSEIGFNISVLITGAGIAGAAISFCASNTINDLLSGFFIVFEGSYKIGDWIKVGDWRGEVLDIGMRTTKIAYADNIKIVNNAAMTNVTVMDITNSGSLTQLEIAYKEDADKVIELLKNSRQYFCDCIPEIEEGPFVKGVTELGASSVTIEVYAFGEQKYAAKIDRGIKLAAKRLFDEKGIEIPFTQVTVHNAED